MPDNTRNETCLWKRSLQSTALQTGKTEVQDQAKEPPSRDVARVSTSHARKASLQDDIACREYSTRRMRSRRWLESWPPLSKE